MDIRVGQSPSVGAPSERTAVPRGAVEARILAIRAPRRRATGPPDQKDRRGASKDRDPVNGRVLVMLIPDGSQLPEGLETGSYRVFLRFARR